MNHLRALWNGNPVATIFLGLVLLAILIVLLAGCGGADESKQDGRSTGYDNVRVQKIVLSADEGGGYLICVSDYHQGIAISCIERG